MAPEVRILESEPNKRGDLFGRLMECLFLALGYDKARLNIAKSGREIDLSAAHRTELKQVVAECKATGTRIGGDDVNKFVGSLDAEARKRSDLETVGYYVSLSGFTETAIEQELDLPTKRVILLNAAQTVSELITGRIVVPEDKATELAGRCVGSSGSGFDVEISCELLAHEIGWIWAVYFSSRKEVTHFSLVHADGNFISSSLAQRIVSSDQAVGGPLHRLRYLSPPPDYTISDASVSSARLKYLTYLEQECGEIQLEGLPADQDVGARRMRLENLFVPLHLVRPDAIAEDPAAKGVGQPQSRAAVVAPRARRPRGRVGKDQRRLKVGQVLAQWPRIAILGLPGGGKSTLLKRLATAYAFPDRRALIDDELPTRDWLPLFIRCRQLGSLVGSSITEILDVIPTRAEMSSDLVECFRRVVSRGLRDGTAMLLLDGLDEISNDAHRLSFVHQLRTFLAIYPNVPLVVTSREAGFRIIGGALSAQCQHFRLDDLDAQDIKKLTLSWHKEVVGDSSQVRTDAEKLTDTICANDRLLELAANPLLLTTLLLVKRWVGQLPTKRTVLYGKAIEVLLMTWNVEGYEPIDPEEAIPQLGYLAYSMMQAGAQTITLRRLREVLTAARTEMPEILGCARMSVSEFIQRVELRSSLLMLSGHTEEDGSLYPTYEFRHLTFQEYLVAHAIVHGHYPGRKEADSLVTLLLPHLNKEQWEEIIPLVAVLSGRLVQPLIVCLIEQCKDPKRRREAPGTRLDASGALLAACLGDEIQAPPDLLREAMRRVIIEPGLPASVMRIGYAKYGGMLYEVACEQFRGASSNVMAIAGNLVEMFQPQHGAELRIPVTEEMAAAVDRMLTDRDPMRRAIAITIVMMLAYFSVARIRSRVPGSLISEPESTTPLTRTKLGEWQTSALRLRRSGELILQVSSTWALAWLAQSTAWTAKDISDLFSDLLHIWRSTHSPDLRYLAPWVMSELPVVDRSSVSVADKSTELAAFLTETLREEKDYHQVAAAFITAYYCGVPWDGEELRRQLTSLKEKYGFVERWMASLSELLGFDGETAAN